MSSNLQGSTSAPELPFAPLADYPARPVRHIVVLDHGRTPTLDHYIRPRLKATTAVPAHIIDIATSPPFAVAEGSFVIIVRYLNDAWARQLLRQRDRLAGVAYLMDDDLPAALRASHLPWRYRFKIYRLFHRQRRALSTLCDAIWVSTPYLAEKYAHPRVTLLPPLPPGDDPGATQGVTYFYHGSASHSPEFTWLRPIVEQVQSSTPHLTFVTVGGARVRRLYADLPRVLVLHPLPWSSYRDSLPHVHHDIGLAPLLANDFNRGRSHTKFYDITRLGAVGLYSRTPPYADYVHEGEDGFLLDNDPDAWIATIIGLANRPEQRLALLARAQARISPSGRTDTGLPLPP